MPQLDLEIHRLGIPSPVVMRLRICRRQYSSLELGHCEGTLSATLQSSSWLIGECSAILKFADLITSSSSALCRGSTPAIYRTLAGHNSAI